ncbi:MAG: hypothetical protein RL291_1289 [Pseudomonadota bacterium]
MSFWKPLRRALIALVVASASARPATAQTPRTPEPAYERVTFPSATETPVTIKALLLKPAGQTQPHATVVMLHGCGGLFTRSGRVSKREVDWSQRFQAAGYAVLLVDSFGSRGLGPQCTVSERAIRPPNRARDVQGAIEWLATQPWADRGRIAVIGWSNGGSTVLNYVRQEFAPKAAGANVRLALAIYPGCRVFSDRPGPRTSLPLEIHMGSADDWTPPEPCIELGKTWNVPVTLYPGAYHGFDAPDNPIRVRTGLAFSKNGDGRAHVGTHPEARAKLIEAVLARLNSSLRRQ